MNYKYARTLGKRERRPYLGLVAVFLGLGLLAGCSLVVAGLVDYGFKVATDAAVEITKDVIKDYVAPPPGVGTYKLGPSIYDQLHRDWKQKIVSKIAHDDWTYRVDYIMLSLLFGGPPVAMDDVEKLCRWNI